MPRYIDADAPREKMFHEAFEKDTQDQKWDSGCWIRYHMFENAIESVPTADVVKLKDLDEIIEGHEQIGYDQGYKDGYAEALADMERSEDVTNRHIQRDRGPEDQM